MKFWWLTDSQRLGRERAAVDALSEAEAWFDLDRWRFHLGRLSAEGTLIAHGHRYAVRLVYPDQFPEVPAWVEPQDAVRWTTHQYDKGTLCLELRPDNWMSSATGVDVLRSAYNLLVAENPLGEGGQSAPSAHNIGALQAYDWGVNPVLIGAGCRQRIIDALSTGTVALRWIRDEEVAPLMIVDAEDRSGAAPPPEADIYSWRIETPLWIARGALPGIGADRAALVAAAGFDAEIAETVQASSSGVVVFVVGDNLVVFNLGNNGATSPRRLVVLPDDGGVRTGRTAEAAAKRIAVVGVGSVGSKIAECLLRSGLQDLTLVDGDVLLPGNLERHTLDWRDVGFRKVQGLKRRLLNIAPGASVRIIDDNLNWQRSAKVHASQVEALADCAVIVDATGDPATTLFLAAVAEANRRPFVTVEVFEGGIGALVAVCLPDRDPSFVDGRATFISWCDAQGAAPPEPGPRRYEMLADDGTPVVADDAAVTMTAGHAARVVLDIVDGDPPSAEAAWLLLGYKRHWIFDGHGHTVRLNVGVRAEPPMRVADEAALLFATGLFEEWLGENRAEQ